MDEQKQSHRLQTELDLLDKDLNERIDTTLKIIAEIAKELQRIEVKINAFDYSDKFIFQKHLQIADGRKIFLGTTTGTRIGSATTEKIGFYNKTPVVQAGAISSPTPPGVAYVQAEAQSARNAIDAIRTVLINLGLTG